MPGYRAFSTLSDGEIRRKYAIGKITMRDGTERSIIDIEREGRELSILTLKAQGIRNINERYVLYNLSKEVGELI